MSGQAARVKLTLVVAMLAALVAPAAALAHGGGSTRGFSSTVTALEPALSGVEITVLGGDDRLRFVNDSGKEIVIEGYDGEPYLRFAADGVYQNTRSQAVYLNDDRFGNVALPPEPSAKAKPRWELVAGDNSFEWHDHHIHWMSPIPPPKVKAAPGQAHHVFDWKIAAQADGEPFAIAGSLDYGPLPGQPNWLLIVGSGATLAAVVGCSQFSCRGDDSTKRSSRGSRARPGRRSRRPADA